MHLSSSTNGSALSYVVMEILFNYNTIVYSKVHISKAKQVKKKTHVKDAKYFGPFNNPFMTTNLLTEL